MAANQVCRLSLSLLIGEIVRQSVEPKRGGRHRSHRVRLGRLQRHQFALEKAGKKNTERMVPNRADLAAALSAFDEPEMRLEMTLGVAGFPARITGMR